MHQVLERYHADGAQTLGELLALLDAAWRRSGLGEQEAELLERGRQALRRYHERLEHESGSRSGSSALSPFRSARTRSADAWTAWTASRPSRARATN